MRELASTGKGDIDEEEEEKERFCQATGALLINSTSPETSLGLNRQTAVANSRVMRLKMTAKPGPSSAWAAAPMKLPITRHSRKPTRRFRPLFSEGGANHLGSMRMSIHAAVAMAVVMSVILRARTMPTWAPEEKANRTMVRRPRPFDA